MAMTMYYSDRNYYTKQDINGCAVGIPFMTI